MILKNLARMIEKVDFFNSSQLLRYKKENDYRTFTGGCISLGIIVVIFLGFANMIIDTLALKSVNYQLKTIQSINADSFSITTGAQHKSMIGFNL